MYPSSLMRLGFSLASTNFISDSHLPSGKISSGTSAISNNISPESAILTCSFTKSTAKEDRFSKTALHCQLSGRSSSSTCIKENPRQNASTSLKFTVERVALAEYVAFSAPESTVSIPLTRIFASTFNTLVCPEARVPTFQVSIPSPTSAPFALASISEGISRVTITSFSETAETFSTSISIRILVASSANATDKLRS